MLEELYLILILNLIFKFSLIENTIYKYIK